MLFARLLPALSVRARIAALALIPVVGFGANAVTYMSSEHEVAAAFEGVRDFGALADAAASSNRHWQPCAPARPNWPSGPAGN